MEWSQVAEGVESFAIEKSKTKSFSAPFPSENNRSSAFSWYLSTTFWPTRNSIRCHVFFKRGQNFSHKKYKEKTWTFNRENKTENHHSLFPLASLIESCSVGETYIEYTLLFFGISLSRTNEASTCSCMYYMLKSAFYTLLIELSSWRAAIGTFEVTCIRCYMIIIAPKPKACLIKTNFLIILLYLFLSILKIQLRQHWQFIWDSNVPN